MYTAKKLREQIAELAARSEAILQTGDLTDELRAELDRINGIGEEGKDGFKKGQIHQLREDLVRIEAVEKRTAELLKRNPATDSTVTQGAADEGQDEAAKIKAKTTPFARVATIQIPIHQQFRHAKLKAFKGQHAEKEAYLSGMFFLGMIGMGMPALRNETAIQWCKDHGIDLSIRNALGENNNNQGGVLVPDETERTIIDLREERGVARRNCKIAAMSSDTLTVPRRTGGLTAYFVDENPSSGITESDKTWDSVRLIARMLATLTRYSMQLGDDAIISIGDDLASEIAYAFADKEDECLFNGSGTSTYGGIVGLKSGTAAGSKVTAATGNTSFDTLDLADFESMVGKLPKYAENNAKWYIHKAGWAASMLRLMDAAGGNTYADLGGRRTMMFLGYPVEHVQVMNSTLSAQTSTDGLAYFGDMNMSTTLGNRRGMTVFASDHRYMEFNQIGVRGTQRFDINYHERGTSSVAGSMIMLSTPSS